MNPVRSSSSPFSGLFHTLNLNFIFHIPDDALTSGLLHTGYLVGVSLILCRHLWKALVSFQFTKGTFLKSLKLSWHRKSVARLALAISYSLTHFVQFKNIKEHVSNPSITEQHDSAGLFIQQITVRFTDFSMLLFISLSKISIHCKQPSL